MSKEPVYWRMRNGKLINVDDMDNNHVRNAFKMLLRNLQKLAEQKNSKPVKENFTLNGDIAQSFINDMETLCSNSNFMTRHRRVSLLGIITTV